MKLLYPLCYVERLCYSSPLAISDSDIPCSLLTVDSASSASIFIEERNCFVSSPSKRSHERMHGLGLQQHVGQLTRSIKVLEMGSCIIAQNSCIARIPLQVIRLSRFMNSVLSL
jgi:hypothetical protein